MTALFTNPEGYDHIRDSCDITLYGARKGQKIDHNTYAYLQTDGSIRIELHSNVIAILTRDEVVLSTAGWNTATTRDRLNKLIPQQARERGWRVGAKKGACCLINPQYPCALPFGIDQASNGLVATLTWDGRRAETLPVHQALSSIGA